MLHFRWKHAVVRKVKPSQQGVRECQVTNGEDYARHYLLVLNLPSKLSLCIVGAEAWKPHFLDCLAGRVLFALYQAEAPVTFEKQKRNRSQYCSLSIRGQAYGRFRSHT